MGMDNHHATAELWSQVPGRRSISLAAGSTTPPTRSRFLSGRSGGEFAGRICGMERWSRNHSESSQSPDPELDLLLVRCPRTVRRPL